jgi:hypothetical protein
MAGIIELNCTPILQSPNKVKKYKKVDLRQRLHGRNHPTCKSLNIGNHGNEIRSSRNDQLVMAQESP